MRVKKRGREFIIIIHYIHCYQLLFAKYLFRSLHLTGGATTGPNLNCGRAHYYWRPIIYIQYINFVIVVLCLSNI